MRYSKQRELVMQTVQNLCDHPTAEEIYDAAVKECPGLSLGTVYRNLNSLVDAGRVRRVSIPGKADRFDHTLPWHSHLYCTVCGNHLNQQQGVIHAFQRWGNASRLQKMSPYV